MWFAVYLHLLPCRCSPWLRGKASSSRLTTVIVPLVSTTKTKTHSTKMLRSESPSFGQEQTAKTPGSSDPRCPRESQTPPISKWADPGANAVTPCLRTIGFHQRTRMPASAEHARGLSRVRSFLLSFPSINLNDYGRQTVILCWASNAVSGPPNQLHVGIPIYPKVSPR